MHRPTLAAIILFILISSCKNDNRYPYPIKDFRRSLQPKLEELVSIGIVGYNGLRLDSTVTDDELIQLSKSEHPVLRAAAFREMLDRKSFDHFDVIMKNLDDTAVVLTDYGEFGYHFFTVSDHLIDDARWKTDSLKDQTIDLVVTRHNYLRSAYEILYALPPKQKYYRFIKAMVDPPPHDVYAGIREEFDDVEYALYGLAKFQRKEDVRIIKEHLERKVWRMGYVSFRLMSEFPDTAYYGLLRQYHRRQFYKFTGNRRGGFTGFEVGRADPEDFIHALVVQKTEKSALLLDTLLMMLEQDVRMPDRKGISNTVVMKIWENPCPAYVQIREKIRPKAEKMLEEQRRWDSMSQSIPLTPDTSFRYLIDTTRERIRW